MTFREDVLGYLIAAASSIVMKTIDSIFHVLVIVAEQESTKYSTTLSNRRMCCSLIASLSVIQIVLVTGVRVGVVK